MAIQYDTQKAKDLEESPLCQLRYFRDLIVDYLIGHECDAALANTSDLPTPFFVPPSDRYTFIMHKLVAFLDHSIPKFEVGARVKVVGFCDAELCCNDHWGQIGVVILFDRSNGMSFYTVRFDDSSSGCFLANALEAII